MGKCDGVIQRKYMRKITALANSLRGGSSDLLSLLTLFSEIIEDVEKMEDREKNIASNVIEIEFEFQVP